MRLLSSSLLLGFLPFTHIVSGYYIDDTCTETQKTFVQKAIENAFMLNIGAVAAEGSPSPAVTQLLDWIFGTDTGTRQRLRPLLEGIDSANQVHNDPSGLRSFDFRVYCTDKRLERRVTTKGVKLYDPDMEENWKLISEFNCAVAVAYTVVPKAGNKPSAIQICPWFLDYAMSLDPAFQNQIDSGTLSKLAITLRKFIAETKYSDIDFVTLFDKVMLHEITHTRAGGRSVDVGGRNGYGWKNIRRLSTTVTSDDGEKPGPEKNADSIAIFASAVRMVQAGATINEDGTFTEAEARRIKRAIAAMRTRSPFLW